MSPRPRNEVEIYEELEHQVRIENLSHNDAYDGEHFSNLIFRRTSPAWHKWTLIIFFITLFFLVLDCFYAIDVYDDKITNSPYFSLTTKNYQFSDVETVESECTLGKNNKKFHPYMSYKLIMNDGVKINIYSLTTQNKSQVSHLDAIETINPKLINAQIMPTITDRALIIKDEPTTNACRSYIRNVYDEKTSDRIFKLFSL